MILVSTDHKISVKGFNSLEDAINYIAETEIDLPEYEHQLPVFPKWLDRNLKRRGEKINLFSLKCTCQAFSDNEIYFRDRDIRKVCSHIFYDIQRYAIKYLDELTSKLLLEQQKFGRQKLYKLDDKSLIGTQSNNDWIKIYLLLDGNWKSFGYNIREKRFSYSRIPPIKAEEIIALYEKNK